MTLSVFKAEVKGPNTLSSFLKSFLKRVSLGNSPLVILINGKIYHLLIEYYTAVKIFLLIMPLIIRHFFQTQLIQNQCLQFVKPFLSLLGNLGNCHN